MIKNQLYPYIEKYINEYLHGFSKEQLKVGVISGTLDLESLNIRPDKVNENLDRHDVPIWLKAGQISKIRISCSLMNFIGEKPLEVSIEDVNLVLTPSFKWILKNIPTFIEENEYHIKEPYDPVDNNSHDIFNKKVNIYDSSVIKDKNKFYEIFTDKSKISEIINKIFTKCLKFYYQKSYLINIKISNVHLRFEDDQLCNYDSNIGLGIKIKNLLINLSTEGNTKKNSFKCESLNFYWEPTAKLLIPSKSFLDSLDKDNNINEKYYEYLKTIKFNDNHNINNSINIIDKFNFMGNFGIQVIESGNLDFFAKNREKNFKFFFQIATSDLNVNIYPDVIKISSRIVDFMKAFFIIEPIQDFKPMRKPYNKLSEIVKKMNGEDGFAKKRKMIVRDWIYYLIWFSRFKKAIYGNPYKNPLHAEYNKYYNICCLPHSGVDNLENNLNNNTHNSNTNYNRINSQYLNDSISLKNKESKDNSLIDNKVIKDEEDLNPEKINLVVFSEILIKGVNINFHLKFDKNNTSDGNKASHLLLKLSSLDLKSFISKDKFELNFDLNNLILSSSIFLNIKNNLEEKIKNSQKLNQFKNNDTLNSDNLSIFSPQNINNEENLNNISIFSNNISNKRINFYETTEQTSRRQGKDEEIKKNSDVFGNKFKTSSTTNNIKQKSFVNILLNDDNAHLFEEKNQKINLSKIINEYNKNIIKEKKNLTIFNTIEKEKSTYLNPIVSEDKINLNIIEIGFIPTHNTKIENIKPNQHVFNFNFCKMNKNTLETLNVNIGAIRINLPTEYISNTLQMVSEYSFLIKLKSKKEYQNKLSSELLNLQYHKKKFELKNLILDKIGKIKKIENLLPISKNQPHNEIIDYISYLKKSIENYDRNIFETGNFEINYLFHLLSKKNVELNLKHLDINIYFYSSDLKTTIGTFKLPNMNLKFSFNYVLQQFYLKFLDFELNLSETDESRLILNNIVKLSKEKIKLNFVIIQPVIQKIINENKIISVLEANNNINNITTSTVNDATTNKIQILKSKKNSENNINLQGLNNILKNNIFINPEKNIPSPSHKKINKKGSVGSMSVESILKSEAKKPKNSDQLITKSYKTTDNQYTDAYNDDFSSPSGIINLENSIENISDYEDLGLIIEKTKAIKIINPNHENVKKIQSFNPKLPEKKTSKIKNSEIKAGGLKLKSKNSGNSNSMNINIK